ncbi:hypothetical protein EY643_18265 [Halioglobus maricola]|uniref:DUF2946 domain-containing protein n=1 Tax=Halioglobus maricola TaxID=2601894 RepID=A0A5P9NPN7_9GAMM|nr:hypothetical protein [Halioglobus maricola]QFU77456.1 hypothetical protein EY643_18265 [Halioglobus maricola]
MKFSDRLSKNATARAMALVALLFAAALQIQEASHDHWSGLDDSYSQCLVCKSGSGAAMPVSGMPILPPVAASTPDSADQQSSHAGASLAFLARGPPQLS